MNILNLHKKARPMLVNRIGYSNSRFDKLVFLIRSLLNRITKDDDKSFNERFTQSTNNQIAKSNEGVPKNEIQAQKLLQKNLKIIQTFQKGRLKRIDEILGTKTHFHETKRYQHRVDSQYIMQISQLKQKHKEVSRAQLDLLNPQMPKINPFKNRKRYSKFLQKLKKYPSGNPELQIFQQKSNQIKRQVKGQLIQFLSEQVLYTRLGLSQLQQTMQSIVKQKLLIEKQGKIIDLELQQQNQFVFNNQVYFKPNNSMQIYRIDSQQYNKQLISSVDKLSQAILNKKGNIKLVISLQEIYQCLKQYYYDQRVSEYLKKLENQEINYFLSALQVSPDGNSIFAIIDLLDTKSEYVGLYKKLTEPHNEAHKESILYEHVIFNIQPCVALRNNGELYCIQRSQQGLFIQLAKIIFAYNTPHSQFKSYEPKQNKSVLQNDKKIGIRGEANKQQRVIYKSKPYQQLKIIQNNINFAQGNKIISNNIILQETSINESTNNKIYVVKHLEGLYETKKKQFFEQYMQQITKNNIQIHQIINKQGVANKFSYFNWQVDPKMFYTQCFQILGIGYIVVRYLHTNGTQGNYLKYGASQRFTNYVTIIPYKGSKLSQLRSNKMNKIQTQEKSLINSKDNSLQQLNNKLLQSESNQLESQFQIQLKTEQWGKLSYFEGNTQSYQLDFQNQYFIYVCPEQQYIYDLKVKHCSPSNIYLLISKSVESVYDKNCLYVHPLRRGVIPYSIYLEGLPIQILNKNTGSGLNDVLSLKLLSPILPTRLQYTLWKRELKQQVNKRIYSEDITIKQTQDGNSIKIRLMGNQRFIKNSQVDRQQDQPVILYLPSYNQRLDDIIVQKLMQKGVIFVEITKCRGIFATNMLELIRGSKTNYVNYIEDVYQTLVFIKECLSSRVGIYAEGPSSCFATLLLNITQNQLNQLFDCSVLHEGVYDISNLPIPGDFFFGQNPQIFKKVNPYALSVSDPTKSIEQNDQQSSKLQIQNLQNVLFSTLSSNSRANSRKFINKLRKNNKIIYQKVFLKQFDSVEEKDIFNLSYLYKTMKQKIHKQYRQTKKQKYENIKKQGQLKSRVGKDVIRNQQKKF